MSEQTVLNNESYLTIAIEAHLLHKEEVRNAIKNLWSVVRSIDPNGAQIVEFDEAYAQTLNSLANPEHVKEVEDNARKLSV